MIKWIYMGLALLLSFSLQANNAKTIHKIEFKSAKVVEAIRIIAEVSETNIVATSEAAERRITLFLKNVSVKHIIESLCKVSGLWYRFDKVSNTYRIMTIEEYQNDLVVYRDDETKIFTLLNPNANAIAQTIEDLYGERVILSFGEAPEIFNASFSGSQTTSLGTTRNTRNQNNTRENSQSTSSENANTILRRQVNKLEEQLSADQLQALSENRTGSTQVSIEKLQQLAHKEAPIYVSVNQEHNLILVRSSDKQAINDITVLVKQLDRPVPQVLLEMKVLDVALGDEVRSIFDYSLFNGEDTSGLFDAQPANPLNPSAIGRKQALGLGNFALEGGSFVYQYLSNHFRARIQLLVQDNKVNVLSTPMVLASNNRPAKVFVGEERILVTGISSNTDTVNETVLTTITAETERREIGNTLEILPKINQDKTILLFIKQETSSVLPGNAVIPISTSTGSVQAFPVDSVSTAEIEGIVAAKDGLTVAIGGLIRHTETINKSKVPLLGDIPYLGQLFRKEEKSLKKSELVLLITPHILTTPGEAETVTNQRLQQLSDHPLIQKKNKVYQEITNDPLKSDFVVPAIKY